MANVIPQSSGKGIGTAATIIAVGAVLVVLIILFTGGAWIKKIFSIPGDIVSGIGDALGPSKEETQTTSDINAQLSQWAQNPTANPFAPAYYKNLQQQATGNKVIKLFSSSLSDRYATQVRNSVGFAYDSPEKAVAVVNACQYKTQLSFIADRFNTLYGEDMLSYMVTHFDTAQQQAYLKNIINTAKALPSGLVTR